MNECDNYSAVHDPVEVSRDQNRLRVWCKNCKLQFTIPIDFNKNVPFNRIYAKIFKRDILQPRDNLYYKIYPERMRITT